MTVVFKIAEEHPDQENAATHGKLHNITGKVKCAGIDEALHSVVPPENWAKENHRPGGWWLRLFHTLRKFANPF